VTLAAELESTIARTPSAVFGELSALERYPEWLTASGVRRVDRLDAGPLAEGSRIRIEQQVAGRATTLEGVVTALELDRRIALRATDPQGITVEIDASLLPEAALTKVRWTIRVTLPMRFRFFESMVAPELRRAAAVDLANLKRHLESVAA
jgi:uncharacterized protein YndB with AHSA1/START domain